MNLHNITHFLDELLELSRYKDAALNGLQVEAQDTEVTRIACAVDCGLGVLQEAVEREAQLLLVHHGLFWSQQQPLTGPLARQVELLLTCGCSLYAAHLPLDGHLEYGNAAQLAAWLDLSLVEGFLSFHGPTVGVTGTLPQPMALTELARSLGELRGAISPIVLPFGSSTVSRVAIVTGSGASALAEAVRAGADVLISGEGKQEAYHAARDLGINAIFAGHYATEVFGVQAVADLLAERFQLETFFIDHPTGF